MSVVLRPPDALPRPPAAHASSAVGGVGAARGLTPSGTTIRCGKCGGARPVGHAHCFTCGAKLTGRAEKEGGLRRAPSWGAVRAWLARPAARWHVLPRVLPGRAPVAIGGQPALHVRSLADRVARWYVTLSAVGAIAWLVWGGPKALPVNAASMSGVATPSEACAWIDAQRVQLTGEAARLVDAQRGGIAQRLGELAVAVGSSPAPR